MVTVPAFDVIQLYKFPDDLSSGVDVTKIVIIPNFRLSTEI